MRRNQYGFLWRDITGEEGRERGLEQIASGWGGIAGAEQIHAQCTSDILSPEIILVHGFVK